jgi:hypothetical protein
MTAAQIQAAQGILTNAWQAVWGRAPTPRELAFTTAIASLETGFGRAGQFAALAAKGQYNWGALEHVPNADGSCPAGTAGGQDAGNARCFYVYPSDLAAATAFVHTLTKTHWPGVVPAMNSGTSLDVATAMTQAPAYFEAKPAAYAALMDKQGVAIPASPASGVPWGWLFLAGLGGAAWYAHAHPAQAAAFVRPLTRWAGLSR